MVAAWAAHSRQAHKVQAALLVAPADLDISLLVHAENEDAAYEALKKAYEL